MINFKPVLLLFATIAAAVNAESHIVKFNNKCGFGKPTLSVDGEVLGGDFTSNGPLGGAIAYLQTGNCGPNGENCTVVETTLFNPTSFDSGSSADISLVPPRSFSVATAFRYTNGCPGQGASCPNAECPAAFHIPPPIPIIAQCRANDVGILITFC
ncbi:glycopeptide [Rickenella mellea]|uniref:Glycopeptide n=1 Tax=Rickenella mellea TaxID=50990 RepID=A0A4Y7PUW8_9AGAM|nr:glycopeptide [Rickenella mellea]